MLRLQNLWPVRAVWALVFGSTLKDGDDRGLYCLWEGALNSVVAFETRDGALRYSLELKAQGLGMPSPTRIALQVEPCAMQSGMPSCADFHGVTVMAPRCGITGFHVATFRRQEFVRRMYPAQILLSVV